MAIGINDLDDDDFGFGEPSLDPSLVSLPEPQNPQQEEDFMSDFLKSKGIDDPSKIKFEDENNQIVERDWKDLTKEEKFNILNTPLETPSDPTNELSEEEINLLNTIRLSNLTPQLYLQSIQGQQVVQEPLYKIDDLSDDELYLLDLESRVGELTDEIATQALATAKLNEELYLKQVEGIRKEYKEREDLQIQQEQAMRELELAEAYNQFQDSILLSINSFDSIGNLNLNFDDSDKEELAEFMLAKDEAGNNYLWQALQEPATLVKAAWFILNGDEALDSISDYFVNLIKLVSENLYKKGFEDAKNGNLPSRPTVVINKNTNRRQQTYNSIEDLDDDD